jgi:NitT/TauT family transport system permease protein
MTSIGRLARHACVALAFIALWKAAITLFGLRPFMLPQPESVLSAYAGLLLDGRLLANTLPTLYEIVIGCGLGCITGIALGYSFYKSKKFEELFLPYALVLVCTPIVCIAPLIVTWFGFGTASKIAVCVLLSFFPAFINTLSGLRAIEPAARNLFLLLGATKKQAFLLLELPSALPSIFAGVKMAAVYSATGAVVGEFVGSKEGLGNMITYYSGLMETAHVLAVVAQLIMVSIVLYWSIGFVEKKIFCWKARAITS